MSDLVDLIAQKPASFSKGVPGRSRELDSLEHAALYASRGRYVFPVHSIGSGGRCTCGRDCESPGKHPRIRDWENEASCDLETVRCWWTQWPDANVGCALGKSGLAAIDVDPRHGGDDSLHRLTQKLGTYETCRSLTGGGGTHDFFTVPTGLTIRSRSNAFGDAFPGVDVKSAGGYVVLPPSLHASGKRYGWEIDTPKPCVLPAAWAEALTLPAGSAGGPKAFEMPVKIIEHSRNETLFRAACSQRTRGFSRAAIIASLKVENDLRSPEPLDEPELIHLVDSAMKYTPKNDVFASRSASAVASVNGLPEISLRCLASIEPEEVEYLWQDRIVFGKVNLLVGDPSSGKSYFSLALAAAVTRGMRLPADDRPPYDPLDVILCNYEDGAADTIRPRADALGADVQRIHLLDGKRDAEGHVQPFSLTDIPALIRELQRRPSVRVLIIDPLGSMLAHIDTHRDADVRKALFPLFDLAEQRKIAVVIVAHLNKTQSNRAIYRVGGSIGFVGAARSVLLFGVDPENPASGDRTAEEQLSRLAAPVEYAITECGFKFIGVAPELDAQRLLAAEPKPEAPERKSKADQAQKWLLEQLQVGEVLATEIQRRAVEDDIAEVTMQRARKALGVISHPHAVRGPRFLRLPEASCLAQKGRDAQQSLLSETGYLSKSDLQTSATDDNGNVAGEESDGNNTGSFVEQLVGRRADGLPTQTTTSREPPSNVRELAGESVDLGDEVRI